MLLASRSCALHALDFRDVPQRSHDVSKVLPIPHLEAEEHGDDVVAVGAFHGHISDVGAGVGNLGREFRLQTALVGDQKPYTGLEHALDVGRPLDVDNLIAVDSALFQCLAVARMH